MTQACYRHPEKEAKRKCFSCRRIICIDCYYRREHHIFCGLGCYLRFFLSDRRERAGEVLSRPIPALTFVAVLLVVLLPAGWIGWKAAVELDAPLLRFATPRRPVPLVAAIRSIEEEENAMAIQGGATPGMMVILLRDGVPIATQKADSVGRFNFQIDLETNAATFSVAVLPPASLASAAFLPSHLRTEAPIDLKKIEPAAIESRPARFVESFERGGEKEQKLVLSFDAGSNDDGAKEILDALRQHGIHTTVFLTGDFIQHYPDITRQIVADGHEVGNHTWDHPHLTTFATNGKQLTLRTMTRERLQGELQRTADLFHQTTGREMSKFWRAPFGEENSEIRGWAAELGYLHVGWTRGPRYNLDSLDWVADQHSKIYFSSSQIADRILHFGQANHSTLNGGIILMHLGTDRPGESRMSRALPQFIDSLEKEGFRLVKVSELRATSGEGNGS